MNQLLLENAEESPFMVDELELLDPDRVPRHVAIIMDGNRRWAEKKQSACEIGHWKGAEIITNIVMAAAELGIQTLTLYAFSTENWGRPQIEIDALMHLFEIYLLKKRDEIIKEGVKLEAIGDLSKLPPRVLEALEATIQATQECKKITLVLAMNYGGRDDIRRAALKAFDDLSSGKFSKEEFTENRFAAYLDTAKWGDPELLIRTSGEMRVSNFLLWQISYAEVVVMKDFWPDFTKAHLLSALLEYQMRSRRIGG